MFLEENTSLRQHVYLCRLDSVQSPLCQVSLVDKVHNHLGITVCTPGSKRLTTSPSCLTLTILRNYVGAVQVFVVKLENISLVGPKMVAAKPTLGVHPQLM